MDLKIDQKRTVIRQNESPSPCDSSSSCRNTPSTSSSSDNYFVIGELDDLSITDSNGNLNLHTIDEDFAHKSPTTSSSAQVSEEQWFHGRLSRSEAEKRLGEGSFSPGKFLIRESDSKPGSFALSCVSTDNSCMHFRITAVCGHFFVGGKEFSSLSEVLRNFRLTQHSKIPLNSPVPPPQPLIPTPKKVVATLPFSGMPDTDELSYEKSDIFTFHQEVGDGWIWVTNERTAESGLVYRSLTEDLMNSRVLTNDLPYFHKGVPLDELCNQLVNAGVNSFLVKPSDKGNNYFSLLLNTGQRVQKFLITEKSDYRFEIGGRQFQSIYDIVERYKELEICDGHKLVTPVLRQTEKVIKGVDVGPSLEEICRQLKFKRLSSRSSCPDAVKAGPVWKKTKEHKKWKPVYLMLKDVESQLFCFDSEKRAKPKRILDLCYCFLQPVDRSLFGRPNCFQVLLNGLDQSVFYFCVENDQDYEEWISLLRPLCSGWRQAVSVPFSSITQLPASVRAEKSLIRRQNLAVKVFEAKQVLVKPGLECYCVVSVNQAKVAKTMSMIPSDCVVWDEEFFIEDIQNAVSQNVKISLLTKGRGRAKDSLIGAVSFMGLRCGERKEGWFQILSGSDQKTETAGELKVSVVRQELCIMPVEEYSSLKEVLIAENFVACHWLGSFSQEDRNALCKSLLGVFAPENNHFALMKSEIEREIRSSPNDSNTLFRGVNFCTTLLNQFIRNAASVYVTEVLRPVVNRILEMKQTFEIDSSRLDQQAQNVIHSNALQLVSIAHDMCRAIFTSAKDIPSSVRYLFSFLKRKVAERWPRDPILKLRAIGSFLFLRLFCLALVDPRQFHLITDSLSRQASRNLVLVAKILQNLANLTDTVGFPGPDLEPVRTFIENTRNHMSSFLNEISSVCPEPEVPESFLSSKNAAKDFALIFQVGSKNLDLLLQKSAEVNLLRSMVSVIELLHNHQNQYLAQFYS